MGADYRPRGRVSRPGPARTSSAEALDEAEVVFLAGAHVISFRSVLGSAHPRSRLPNLPRMRLSRPSEPVGPPCGRPTRMVFHRGGRRVKLLRRTDHASV